MIPSQGRVRGDGGWLISTVTQFGFVGSDSGASVLAPGRTQRSCPASGSQEGSEDVCRVSLDFGVVAID